MSTQNSLETLLRTDGFDPSLVRFLPLSLSQKIRTIPLAKTKLVDGLSAEFDETCQLTIVDGAPESPPTLKLSSHPGKRSYSGIHLTILGTRGQLTVTLADDHAKLLVGSNTIVRANVQMFGRPRLFIGDGTTIGQARIIAANADVVIGEDCQFSDEVIVQSSDQHPIIDLDSGEVLNAQRHFVHLDRHVWVGRRAMIMPDVRIAEGSIVAAGALVTNDVASHTIVGGVPARVVRQRVSWAREFPRRPVGP